MADILIKGIELPKGDRIFRTVEIFKDGTVFQDGERIGQVIEVKPHGRLIDADALPIKDEWTLVGTDVVWDAQTVLEASNGKVSD